MRKFVFTLVLLVLGIGAVTLKQPTSRPADEKPSPIVYRHDVRTNPPLHLHIITIDLTDPRVKLRVCTGGDDPDGRGPWDTTLQTARAIAEREHLAVAVNANFFATKEMRTVLGRQIPYFIGNWARVASYAMSDGKMLGRETGIATLMVDREGAPHIEHYTPRLPEDAWLAVSGSAIILKDGKLSGGMPERVPRTCVGISEDGKKMVFLVVDGRRDYYSVGMSGDEAASELLKLGCWRAVNLDGGGSSTMVLRDPASGTMKLMNRPSDGHDLPIAMSFERAVAVVLGVELREPDAVRKP